MSEPTRPPVTTWVVTEQQRAEKEIQAKIKTTIDRMCERVKQEGASPEDVSTFRSAIESLDPLALYTTHMVFWESRHQAAAAARFELNVFLGAGALLVLFMPQYFFPVSIIWVATIIRHFTGYRRVLCRLITSGIMHLVGAATLAHAAYNLLFG